MTRSLMTVAGLGRHKEEGTQCCWAGLGASKVTAALAQNGNSSMVFKSCQEENTSSTNA